jgi:hypothetical protein
VQYGNIPSITTGLDNTLIGYNAGDTITTESQSVYVGSNAGKNSTNNTSSVGIGFNAGQNITGSNNICIGANSTVPVLTASNQIAIGTSSDTMYIRGGFNWRVGTLITASITVSAPLAQLYPVAMASSSRIITLPAPNNTNLLGAYVSFKRKTNTTAFTFGSTITSSFISVGSITAVSTISMGTGLFQCNMVCDGSHWCVINLY